MGDDTTTIEVSIETYQNLGSRKRPSESFDDTIDRELREKAQFEDQLNEVETRLHSLEDVIASDHDDEMAERAALTLVREAREVLEESDDSSDTISE